MTQCIEKAES